MSKFLMATFLTVAMLSGCQERYRYHCQDPKNWQAEECTHPKCEATQTCTDYLIHKD
jgi:hypothetical protein